MGRGNSSVPPSTMDSSSSSGAVPSTSLEDEAHLLSLYPDGYFFANTVRNTVLNFEAKRFKYQELSTPPSQQDIEKIPYNIRNFYAVKTPLLYSVDKRHAQIFMDEYADYRRRGGLQPI